MDNEFYRKYYDKVYENEKQLLTNFLAFVGKSIVFTHNAIFDYNFISKELDFHKLPRIPRENFRCTLKTFQKFNPQQKYSLEKCADHFQIEYDKTRLHSGIYDTEVTAKVLEKIFEKVNLDGGRKESKDFSQNSGSKTVTTNFGSPIHDRLSINTINLPSTSEIIRTPQDLLKLGLLSTMDESGNSRFGEHDNSDQDFLSAQKELSVCVSAFSDLSLAYTDSKVTTNNDFFGNNIGNNITNNTTSKMNNLKELNRNFVINASMNKEAVQKPQESRKREFESKLDKNTFKQQFDNITKK